MGANSFHDLVGKKKGGGDFNINWVSAGGGGASADIWMTPYHYKR